MQGQPSGLDFARELEADLEAYKRSVADELDDPFDGGAKEVA